VKTIFRATNIRCLRPYRLADQRGGDAAGDPADTRNANYALDGASLAVLARFWSTYFNSCWPVNLSTPQDHQRVDRYGSNSTLNRIIDLISHD